ncbi:hypothetical protein ACIQMY_20580 [Streptomyces sp. NPDC091368]|uniref:hypothetical protein n=1 Tax=Streptomyces sp. NPDC091368 TaxID=3365993 RepID=UPI0037F538C4
MATTSGRPRPCNFCPEPDADVCIRAHRSESGDITHVYAHRECADDRGVLPLYVYIASGAEGR